ncbi:iron ascorbate-dependent oxidoreductase [Fragilaria crotonensis]|nr:iron ascorbate-dependent oxidoreductase [Fragilaria crotonensis]
MLSNSQAPSIPLIDLKPFLEGNDEDIIVRQVSAACREIGFFAIRNHGIDSRVIGEIWHASAAFFDLPLSEKELVMSTDPSEYPFGYERSENLELAKTGTKSFDDLKETFSLGPSNPASGMPARRIPHSPVDFESAIKNYYEAMEQLALSLAQVMALGLELSRNHFVDKMDRHQSALRLLNYPNVTEPTPPGQLRAGAHTDYGAFTILKSGGPGLQVKRDQTSDSWVDVPTFDSEDVFIINLGDMMQRWTNDQWVSTLHRVIVPPFDGQDHRRQSIAFFVNINGDADVETLSTCIDDDHPLKYEPVTAGQYVLSKYLKSMGEE